jgi:large subunit ribosomal protein L28
MSRECELSGTKPMVGNRVSHSQSQDEADLPPESGACHASFRSPEPELPDAYHGFHPAYGGQAGRPRRFLAKAKDDTLPAKALKIKRDIAKKAVA